MPVKFENANRSVRVIMIPGKTPTKNPMKIVMMKNLLAAAAIYCVATGVSAASSQTYHCQFKDGHRNNAVPPQVIVELAADGKSAGVIDSISHRRNMGPVAAKFVRNTTERLRVRWTLKDIISSSGQKATLNFSLTHKKNTGKAFLNMDIPGYGNTESGTGSCELRR